MIPGGLRLYVERENKVTCYTRTTHLLHGYGQAWFNRTSAAVQFAIGSEGSVVQPGLGRGKRKRKKPSNVAVIFGLVIF